MKQLTSDQLRSMFLKFFEEKGHAIIPGASLIPENDPTVLFTTAGMHPLVPYLLGEPHPMGKRLCDVQKCVRTGDIDDVGDDTHCTFFEMLGNWSLGDFFKKEAIEWSWEFLTSEKYLGIDPDQLAFTVFAGDEDCPRDEESAQHWMRMGVKPERIFYLPKENNWWGPAGMTGPCGPDTEMFIDTGKEKCCEECSPACDCGKYIEIWNNVFMEYNKTAEGTFEPLKQKNVDTGMGLERTIGILQGKKSVYETDLFQPILKRIEELSKKQYGQDERTTHAMRIVADHIRSATFILADPANLTPSNVDRGYVLRRLIRRAVRFGIQLGMEEGFTAKIADAVIEKYQDFYTELRDNRPRIERELIAEEQKFAKTIQQGIHEFTKLMDQLEHIEDMIHSVMGAVPSDETTRQLHQLAKQVGSTIRVPEDEKPIVEALQDMAKAFSLLQKAARKLTPLKENRKQIIDGKTAFKLYDTFGFPLEMTCELAKEKGIEVDTEGFQKQFEKHQEKSHAGAEQRFQGGLADHTEQTTRLHTATHLLNAALRKRLDPNIRQKGSNITAERLRFDFNFDRKLTPEEIQDVEDMVNEVIRQDLPITCTEMTVQEAKDQGAIGVFDDKYGTLVKVYKMGDFSMEICGGPHAKSTGELGHFKIQKESSSSAGVRRIRAVLTEDDGSSAK